MLEHAWPTSPALQRLIEPEVKRLGYELVRVTMIGGTSDPTLQVMAERPDTRQLDLADCETMSRRLSDMLDRRRPDRGQLSARGQLARHRPAADPAQGLCRLDGPRGAHHARRAARRPQAVLGHARRASTATTSSSPTRTAKPTPCPFSAIASAKLLLTDKLINATAPLSTEGADTHRD